MPVSGQRHGPLGTRTEPHTVDGRMSRRGFLSGGSAAAAAVVMSRYPAKPPEALPNGTEPVITGPQRRMILQMARAGMVFPLRLPARDQADPARAQRAISRLRAAQHRLGPGLLQLGAARRPSLAGLRVAESAMPPAELATARAGADLLIGAGLLNAGHGPLLTGIGQMAAMARPPQAAGLQAAATLAVRSVFSEAAHHRVRDAAGQWLNLLSAMHERGTLRPAVRQRGLR